MPTYEAHVIYGKHWGDLPGALLISKLYSNFAHFRKDVNEEQKYNIFVQTICFLLNTWEGAAAFCSIKKKKKKISSAQVSMEL